MGIFISLNRKTQQLSGGVQKSSEGSVFEKTKAKNSKKKSTERHSGGACKKQRDPTRKRRLKLRKPSYSKFTAGL